MPCYAMQTSTLSFLLCSLSSEANAAWTLLGDHPPPAWMMTQ